jgi:hypothetical protein
VAPEKFLGNVLRTFLELADKRFKLADKKKPIHVGQRS